MAIPLKRYNYITVVINEYKDDLLKMLLKIDNKLLTNMIQRAVPATTKSQI